jgi:hypothetical protein
MKLRVHVRIKFNSVVSRYHLMSVLQKNWVRASVSQFILSGAICTKRRKNIWSHNSIEQQWPLNSRAKPTPLDFLFLFFLKPKFIFALLSSRSPWPLWCNLRRCQLWRVGLTFFCFSFCFYSIYMFFGLTFFSFFFCFHSIYVFVLFYIHYDSF